MSKLSPARKLALDVLMEADRRGMYARDVLSSRASAKAIDQRDSAFAARLALGVAATQGILDELLDQFLDKPKKVAPRVRMALRISAFEMLYLHTPGRVAVSQGVELVRCGAKSAAGLANAVLHKVADNVEDFATASDVDESERRLVRLSRLMGLPRQRVRLTLPAIWLPRRWPCMRTPLRLSPIRISRSSSRLFSRAAMPRLMPRLRLRRAYLSVLLAWPRTLTPSLSPQLPRALVAALRLVPVVAPRPM